MRALPIALALLLFACGGKSAPSAQSTDPALAGRDASALPVMVSPDAGPTASYGCVHDARAARDCQARGSGFSYGPQQSGFCGGAAPSPEEEQAELERIRTSPCVCTDIAAVAREREICGRIP